jgi:hypothetical protein
MDRDEAEYLRKLREHVAETRWIFSNKMKPERERMVCRAFLRCLGIAFHDTEIITADTEPIDVIFRSAQFQIRELMEPDRKRGDELRELQQKVQSAASIEDVMIPYSPSRPLSFQVLVPELTNALGEKARKYGTGCRDLDALVYVDLESHLDANSVIPDLSKLKSQGWRSVSVLLPPYGMVLFTESSAPAFIQMASGQVVSKCGDLNTLFDEHRPLSANHWVEKTRRPAPLTQNVRDFALRARPPAAAESAAGSAGPSARSSAANPVRFL